MIRPANLNDVARLAEMNVYGWRHAYRGIISDEILFGKLTVKKRFE